MLNSENAFLFNHKRDACGSVHNQITNSQLMVGVITVPTTFRESYQQNIINNSHPAGFVSIITSLVVSFPNILFML